jgi:hypothetical protein
VSGRSTAVLDRFPRHLALSDPGKRVGTVAEGLTAGLDLLSRQVGDVRASRRLSRTPTWLDLRRIAGLHGISALALSIVELRKDALAGADPADTAALGALTNIPQSDLDAVDPVVLAEAVAAAVRFTGRLDDGRQVVRGVIDAHRIGNGTSTSLLDAAAAYLGFHLDPDAVTHSADRWWHLAEMVDSILDEVDGHAPAPEVLALEENPHVDASVPPVARSHGDRFRIRRGGLEDVTTSVIVVGIADRTVAPMVVNVDAGRGVVFEGTVPDGEELAFEFFGSVRLGTDDVTGSAFTFTGGVFADAGASHAKDFVFGGEPPVDGPVDDRVATFVVTAPPVDGFDQVPTLPHGGLVPGLPLPLGESRWSFFVRTAHHGSEPLAAVARNAAGRFDESVFVDETGPLAPSGEVGFEWEEREPFAVRILLPQRLALVDDEAGTRLREPLRMLLDRHRPAGIRLSVTYADPRWELGSGVTRDLDSNEWLGTVLQGTTLWPDGSPQPTPT